MKKTRHTLTIHTEEVCIIKRRQIIVRSFCRQCNREVSMVMPDEAARLCCRDLDTINNMMTENYFHLFFYKGTKPMICLNSLCAI